MALGDPKTTVAIFTARSPAAFAALELTHNQSRVKAQTFPSKQRRPKRERKRRQRTPIVAAATESQLVLSLSEKPIDPLLGFVFGSDEEKCDILLCDEPSKDGISRVHFRIDFNWESGALIIIDTSSHGTPLQSKVAGRHVLLQNRALPLFSGDTLQAGYVLFTVTIPDRGKYRQCFRKNWEEYYREYKEAIPRIGGLAIQQPEIKTYLDSAEICLVEEIGSGSCGTVHKAVDAAGNFYAVKTFNSRKSPSENDQQKYFRREIETLHSIKHDYIVPAIKDKVVSDLTELYLVMEFVEEGTLEDLQDLSFKDTALMVHQTLDATLYLHVTGYAHRDLKSANILVKSISPLVIQLSDFGFTSRDPLKTFCGSFKYAAPEIYLVQKYENFRYTSAIDIWAIDVIILEYSNGLPSTPTP
ncbi:hypothetical protein FQN54_009335 [Arachnomyces sp. PD_36]|nr:hypothetical protein FQN54_009335 [Arachnomyces sp. PD_36]